VSAETVTSALEGLQRAGLAAGLDAAAIEHEAAAFVAAIIATAPGAPDRWAVAFSRPVAAFGASAQAGRSWRDQPTPLLSRVVEVAPAAARSYADALADMASAAYGLADSNLSTLGAAGIAAAAQLRVVGGPAVAAHDTVNSAGVAAPIAMEVATTEAAAATEPPLPTLDELLAQLDALVGLAEVKAEVHRQAELLRIETKRSAKGLKTPDVARHLVFVGNPGTGKSTVARLVGGIYRALGLLREGHLIETDRSGLVGGYLGQTAEKTAALLKTAFGGLFFIDEAYALVGDQYGDEAIATLVKAMEDHRDDLVVIVAGYPGPMSRFIGANPGLASRFHLTIEFTDYSDDELVTIFERLCAANDFTPDDACITSLRLLLVGTTRGEGFGNARFIRNTFEAAVVRQAWRLRDVADPTVEQLRELRADDLLDATSPLSPEAD